MAKREEDPVTRFMDATADGAVVYADGGNWSKIRDKFKLRTVSHKHYFYTPESCTNFAESGFSVLGMLERILRHITGNYLDLYAAQLAWRLSRIRMSDDEGFDSIMTAMINGGRSPMAGYFLPRAKGGAKRRCEIVNPDGTVGYWSPPTREERRRAQEAARKAANTPRTPLLRTARSANWKRDF